MSIEEVGERICPPQMPGNGEQTGVSDDDEVVRDAPAIQASLVGS